MRPHYFEYYRRYIYLLQVFAHPSVIDNPLPKTLKSLNVRSLLEVWWPLPSMPPSARYSQYIILRPFAGLMQNYYASSVTVLVIK